jgi:hypothetical protein
MAVSKAKRAYYTKQRRLEVAEALMEQFPSLWEDMKARAEALRATHAGWHPRGKGKAPSTHSKGPRGSAAR